MPQTPPSLPSPRTFLTTLLSTLTETSASTTHPSPPAAQEQQPSQPGNALQDVEPEAKGLISTLHVLFPTLVLPALDLLDRGLVTRIFVQDGKTQQSTDQQATQQVESENAKHQEETNEPKIGGGTYIVRSITSTMRRRAAESKYYLVLLTSWSCTCPAFTFDAFPPRTASAPLDISTPSPAGFGEGLSDRGDSEWSFGGLSLDGLAPRGGSVPCCKHLLACVLAERWGRVLGRYALERMVTREEMAGLVAEL